MMNRTREQRKLCGSCVKMTNQEAGFEAAESGRFWEVVSALPFVQEMPVAALL